MVCRRSVWGIQSRDANARSRTTDATHPSGSGAGLVRATSRSPNWAMELTSVALATAPPAGLTHVARFQTPSAEAVTATSATGIPSDPPMVRPRSWGLP